MSNEQELSAENARLKAEVERLTTENAAVKLGHADWKATAIERLDELIHDNSVIANLKAEVERLRKAGDELLHEWSSGDETNGRNFMKGLVIWNAAKEGKQS